MATAVIALACTFGGFHAATGRLADLQTAGFTPWLERYGLKLNREAIQLSHGIAR